MDELTQTRLIVAAVVGAIVGAWMLSRHFDKRREQRFVALAQSLGTQIERESEFLSRFHIEVEGRAFEVCQRHIGGAGASGLVGWYLVTSTKLKGVSDLHATTIRPRSKLKGSAHSADDFLVRDQGYPLKQGWLTAAVAQSLAQLYTAEISPESIDLEEGKLIQRSRTLPGANDGPRLLGLLKRQGVLAAQLERSL